MLYRAPVDYDLEKAKSINCDDDDSDDEETNILIIVMFVLAAVFGIAACVLLFMWKQAESKYAKLEQVMPS